MDSKEAAKLLPGGDIVVDSETTVEIKIKTLDSQTYTIRVDKCVPVPALKEQIADVTGVVSEQQRLICRGKVLKDDQLLSAYHVEDGHTLHLVVREPHIASPASQMGTEGASGPSSITGNAHGYGSRVHSFVFETSNVGQGDIDSSVISRMIASMLGSIESTNIGHGNFENDIREMISERIARASSDMASSDSTHSQPNLTNPLSHRRSPDLRSLFTAPVGSQPTVIPDSLTTLSQYIGFMRGEFETEGFHASVGEGNQDSHMSTTQVGLPTPASLAEILRYARQLLMEQTGECLLQLARQVEGHTSITDPQSRIYIQTRAIRSGVLMQNLGSMLLELGRTTMTLRMGQNPAEAIVNAGPATFVSATAPNPLMVQAVPFASTGTANSEQFDTGIPSRNIEIRIRRVPVPASNESEQAPADANPQQDQTDQARNNSSRPNVDIRALSFMPFASMSPQTDSSTGLLRMIPLIARIRNTSASSTNEDRATQVNHQTVQNAPRENISASNSGETIPATPGISNQQNRPDNDNNSETPANDDANRATELHGSARAGTEQGVFLSNILRGIIPLISGNREFGILPNNPSSSTAETVRENLNGSSSSNHQLNPPEAPSPKRMKRE